MTSKNSSLEDLNGVVQIIQVNPANPFLDGDAIHHAEYESIPGTSRNSYRRENPGTTANPFVVAEQAIEIQQREENAQSWQMPAVGATGEVAIQIGSNDEDDELVEILQWFLQLMYFSGLSTYDPRLAKKKSTSFFSRVFFKGLFWVVAVLAFLDALHVMKLNWMFFAELGGMTNFVDVGFHIVPVLAEIYIAHLFAFQHRRIKRMITSFSYVTSATTDNKSSSVKMARCMLKISAVVSILACAMETCFADVGFMDWSVKKVILSNAGTIGYGMFVWNPKDITNTNISDTITLEYGTNVNWYTLTMGIMGMLMDLGSNLKLELLVDFIFVAGWCLKERIRRQANKVKNIDFSSYTNGDDSAELDSPTGDWAKYQELKKANKAMNLVLDGVLKFMHVYNTMMCAYFLMHLMDTSVTGLSFWFLVYNIVKLSVAYYVAKQSHAYNAVFQKWIRDWAKHSKDTEFLLKVPALLDEMKAEPLGLGTGEFIIGESFLLKFVGMIGSIFMLQVDK